MYRANRLDRGDFFGVEGAACLSVGVVVDKNLAHVSNMSIGDLGPSGLRKFSVDKH